MLLGELLPSNARGIGSSIVTTSNIISIFVVVKLAPSLEETMSLDGMFWMFTSVTIGVIVFAYFCVPETFGKSLEEIEHHYRSIPCRNKVRPVFEAKQ